MVLANQVVKLKQQERWTRVASIIFAVIVGVVMLLNGWD